MALIYEAMELVDEDGKPSGRWRQTLRTNDNPRLAHPLPLCQCSGGHTSRQAARECPAVQAKLPEEMREQPEDPQDIHW